MGYNKTIIAHIGGKYVGTNPPANKDLIWFDKNLTGANRIKYYNEANSTWESFMGSVGITESLNGTPNSIPYFNSEGDFTTGLNLSYNNTTKETFLTKLKLLETDDSMHITTTGSNQKLKIGSPYGLIHESFGGGAYLSDSPAYILGIDSNGVQKEVNVSALKNIWFNEDGTTATSASTNIKYDRGNVTIGTPSVAFDLFQITPTTSTVESLLSSSSSASVSRFSHVFDPIVTIPNNIYKTLILNRQVFNSNAANLTDVSGFSVTGIQSVMIWSSPTPIRQMNALFTILTYKGADVNGTGATLLSNSAGQVTLIGVTDKTQTVNTINGKYVSFQNAGSSNTIQIVSTIKNVESYVGTNLTLSNTVNINTLEQFTNSGQSFNNTGLGSSLNITNLYGLRLTTPTTYLNTNITNNYGISQEWSSAKNYFAGFTQFNNTVGIGASDTSGYKLYVVGSTWLNGSNNYIDGITILRGSNAIEIARFHSNLNFGIGTNNPTKKLHLVGQARFESYSSSTYDVSHNAARVYKQLAFNLDGDIVSVPKKTITSEAYIGQNSHGFTTITPLRFDTGTGAFVPASATSESLLATTVFLKAEDVNTMVLGVSCMFELVAHGFVVGGRYYTNPSGTGVVLEADLPSGLSSNRTQLVFTVLSSDVIQINLQNHVH